MSQSKSSESGTKIDGEAWKKTIDAFLVLMDAQANFIETFARAEISTGTKPSQLPNAFSDPESLRQMQEAMGEKWVTNFVVQFLRLSTINLGGIAQLEPGERVKKAEEIHDIVRNLQNLIKDVQAFSTTKTKA